MLISLYIKNFVLIDELTIEFSPNLNIITGETGAGKSIILGALNLILGQRADTSVHKHTDHTCVIQGSFNLKNYDLVDLFQSEELDYTDTSTIRREIRSNGKSRVFINDNQITLSTLKKIAYKIIDIHEQFDNHFLTQKDFQFDVVDSLAQQKQAKANYTKDYQQLKTMENKLQQEKSKIAESNQRKDFLAFQIHELEQLNYTTGEFQALESDLTLSKNAELIDEIIQQAGYIFDESEQNIPDQIRSLRQKCQSIGSNFAPIQQLEQRLESVLIEIDDIQSEFALLNDQIDIESQQSEIIESRMAEIFRIMKKHQLDQADDLIALQTNLQQEIEAINHSNENLDQLEKAIAAQKIALEKAAQSLSDQRKKQLPIIRKAILDKLSQLQLTKAQFEIKLSPSKELNEYGKDDIQYLFTANPGMPLGPIDKVASGGELSRLALAIKALVAKSIPLPTIVFDEIDAGVSGSAADKMGTVLHQLSRDHQVICITHSPQVASKADQHLYVYKHSEKKHTQTQLSVLDIDQRIHQLAIMLSSDPPSEIAIQNAKYLIEQVQSN